MSHAWLTQIADESLEFRQRINSDYAESNIWCKNEQARPRDAVFVLAHEVYCQIDHFDQVIWFARAECRDELWAITGTDTGLGFSLSCLPKAAHARHIDNYSHQCARVFSVPRLRTFDESLIDLLSCYFSTQAGAPRGLARLVATGYVSQDHYELLYERVLSNRERRERESKDWTRPARQNETEIIRVARELGLNPEPAGTGPSAWYSRCPGRPGHRLMILSGSDEYFCGYCSAKGGVAELRALDGKEAGHEHLA